MFHYLYIRCCESYDIHNALKLGICSILGNRDDTYRTSEIKRGYFTLVIELEYKTAKNVELKLKNKFTEQGFHVYIDAGTEFFKKDIEHLIIPYLKEHRIGYRKLSNDEINDMCRKYYEQKEKLNKIIPYEYQQLLIDKIKTFYENNDIATILWACGLGKALLSIFVVQLLKYKKALIGVPNRYLQKQMLKEIQKIFPKRTILCVGSNNNVQSTTDKKKIITFIEENTEYFIITTYTSCHLLTDINFDFKIGDEAHHLTGRLQETKQSYLKFHKIQSKKTLFMTATEKLLHNTEYSMDSEIFGEIIDIKSILWAIENKKITDYKLCVFKNNESEIMNIVHSLEIGEKKINLELFLSAFISLKAIDQYNYVTHILCYTNTTENSDLVEHYIDLILDTKIFENINTHNFYNKSLHCRERLSLENEVLEFKNKIYGIISCVYIFGEGFDLPELNGITFAENMDSHIRIIQCFLRASRLNKLVPNKISCVLLPYVEDSKSSFHKIKEIIHKIGNEDKKLEYKMNVFSVINTSKNTRNTNNTSEIVRYDMLQNEQELHKIKLRLRFRKALHSDLSEEQDEYNYVREINREFNFMSKMDYVKSKLNHRHYIEDPQSHFGPIFTNWYDFLGIDTSTFIKTKKKWKAFCHKNNCYSNREYEALINKFPLLLPYEPSDFYMNCSSVYIELKKTRRRR